MNKYIEKMSATLMVCGALTIQNLHGEEAVEQVVLVEAVEVAADAAPVCVVTEKEAAVEEVAAEETEETVATEEQVQSDMVVFTPPRSLASLMQLMIDIQSGKVVNKYSQEDMVKIFNYISAMNLLFAEENEESSKLASVYGYKNGEISSEFMLSEEERAEWFANNEKEVELMQLALDFFVGDLEKDLTDEQVLERNAHFQAELFKEFEEQGMDDSVKLLMEKMFQVFAYNSAE